MAVPHSIYSRLGPAAAPKGSLGPPQLPPLPTASVSSFQEAHRFDSPVSPAYDSSPLYRGNDDGRSPDVESQYYTAGQGGRFSVGRQYSDEIPLTQQAEQFSQHNDSQKELPFVDEIPPPPGGGKEPQPRITEGRRRRKPREPEKKKGFFEGKVPWVVYGLTIVQVVVFIAELIKNGILTSTPIEIHPSFNPMIGPSYYVLINMGARYVPCMKDVTKLGIPANTVWPCPNTTSSDPNDPLNQCALSDLCGFPPLGNPPNQWFRFITPIFLHGGIIHIGFNMLLQLTLGREMEKIIGSVRFFLVYMASGIFGFVLGGNFAPDGIVSMGASGSLFGVVAINLLDLLYTWRDRVSPWKELMFIVLDIVISFVLGLLPGLDNFSHIGGFLMGLVSGICIIHSPNILRVKVARPTSQIFPSGKTSRRNDDAFKSFAKGPLEFFKRRKMLWWAWWLVRVGALIGVLIGFVLLINNFYNYDNTCTWCKYLSCLNVSNWCDVGNLNSQLTNTTHTTRRSLFAPGAADLSSLIQ